jgi:hypothetical protein
MSNSTQSAPLSPLTPLQPKFNIDYKGSLHFVLRRLIVNLFKEYLAINEKVQSRHIEGLNKLYDALPPDYKQYVDLADWLTDEEAERIRKEVLQRGNDAIRLMEIELDKYTIGPNAE